jgi:hypothetical protein
MFPTIWSDDASDDLSDDASDDLSDDVSDDLAGDDSPWAVRAMMISRYLDDSCQAATATTSCGGLRGRHSVEAGDIRHAGNFGSRICREDRLFFDSAARASITVNCAAGHASNNRQCSSCPLRPVARLPSSVLIWGSRVRYDCLRPVTSRIFGMSACRALSRYVGNAAL